jgi:hypothetical protein
MTAHPAVAQPITAPIIPVIPTTSAQPHTLPSTPIAKEVPLAPAPKTLPEPVILSLPEESTQDTQMTSNKTKETISFGALMDVNPAPTTKKERLLPVIKASPAPAAAPQAKEPALRVAKPIRIAKEEPTPALPPLTPPAPKAEPKQHPKEAREPKKEKSHQLTPPATASDALRYPIWITSAYFANETLAEGIADELSKRPELGGVNIMVTELPGDAAYGVRVGPFATKSAVKHACNLIRSLRHLKKAMQGSCSLEVQLADRNFVPAQSLIRAK